MEISIIIVNYKTPKLTKKCMASIKKYPPKVSYEIIVINNSIDNTGFAKANNQGIKKAKGKYIFLLNSDTEVTSESIDKLYEFAQNHPDAGAVVPKLLNPDGSIQASCFRFPTLERAIQQYWFGEKGLLDKYIPMTSYQQPTTTEVAVMAAFLITPVCLKQIGMLDEKYFMYFEDFDYCRRVKLAGLKIFYLPQAKIIHLHGASGGTNKTLVESAKKYHGFLGYCIYTFILWSGQKLKWLKK